LFSVPTLPLGDSAADAHATGVRLRTGGRRGAQTALKSRFADITAAALTRKGIEEKARLSLVDIQS
jgi:hypothetical protein